MPQEIARAFGGEVTGNFERSAKADGKGVRLTMEVIADAFKVID